MQAITATFDRLAARRAKNLAWSSAHELQRDGQRAADKFAEALGWAEQAGASKESLDLLRSVLLDDVFGTIQGGINRMLDNEGLTEDQHQIDLSELRVPT